MHSKCLWAACCGFYVPFNEFNFLTKTAEQIILPSTDVAYEKSYTSESKYFVLIYDVQDGHPVTTGMNGWTMNGWHLMDIDCITTVFFFCKVADFGSFNIGCSCFTFYWFSLTTSFLWQQVTYNLLEKFNTMQAFLSMTK